VVGNGNRGVSDCHAIAPRVLGPVEGIIGKLHEQVDTVGSFIEGRHSDRDSERVGGLAAGRERNLANALTNFIGTRGGLS
jgi:hypothetical protein